MKLTRREVLTDKRRKLEADLDKKKQELLWLISQEREALIEELQLEFKERGKFQLDEG